MVDWLVEECTENRRLWSKSDSSPATPPKRYWRPPSEGEHDPRGVASFVQSREYFLPVHWYGSDYDPDALLDNILSKRYSSKTKKKQQQWNTSERPCPTLCD